MASFAFQYIYRLSSAPQPLQANFIDIAIAVTTDLCGGAPFVTGCTSGVMLGRASRGAQGISSPASKAGTVAGAAKSTPKSWPMLRATTLATM